MKLYRLPGRSVLLLSTGLIKRSIFSVMREEGKGMDASGGRSLILLVLSSSFSLTAVIYHQ